MKREGEWKREKGDKLERERERGRKDRGSGRGGMSGQGKEGKAGEGERLRSVLAEDKTETAERTLVLKSVLT